MSTKFSRDSGADIWTHLNALDDEAVRWFPTKAAGEAATPNPTAGMRMVTGSGANLVEWMHDGATWNPTYQPPQDFVPVITASAGAFTTVTATCRWSRSGRMITATYNVIMTNAGTAAGSLIATLPVAGRGGVIPEHGIGHEVNVVGVALVVWRQDPNVCWVNGYDNASKIGTGRVFRWTITYEAAV